MAEQRSPAVRFELRSRSSQYVTRVTGEGDARCTAVPHPVPGILNGELSYSYVFLPDNSVGTLKCTFSPNVCVAADDTTLSRLVPITMRTPIQLLRGLLIGIMLASLMALSSPLHVKETSAVDMSRHAERMVPADGNETQTTPCTLSALHSTWAVPTPPSTTGTQGTSLSYMEETVHRTPKISAAHVPSTIKAKINKSGLFVLILLGTIYGIRKLQIQGPKKGSVAV